MDEEEALARLIALAGTSAPDAALLRAVVEEASELGARRALARLGLRPTPSFCASASSGAGLTPPPPSPGCRSAPGACPSKPNHPKVSLGFPVCALSLQIHTPVARPPPRSRAPSTMSSMQRAG